MDCIVHGVAKSWTQLSRLSHFPPKKKKREHSLLMNKQYLKSLRFGKSYKIICSGGGGDLVTKLCLTLATPWTIACQAPLAIGFSRQEYWSRLPFPSPGDLPEIICIL